MAFTTVTRPTLHDDTGDGESGDRLDAAFIGTNIFDVIDALFSAAAGLSCNGPVYERGRAQAIGEWLSFTPVWTNLTVGNGTQSFKYCRVGKMVFLEGLLTLGSTSTVSGGGVVMSLPVSNSNLSIVQILGDASFYDASATTVYPGRVYLNGATSGVIYNLSSPSGGIATASPFTWATGDNIFIRLCYQEP